MAKLDEKQSQVLDLALHGHNIFLGGGGGTGKAFCSHWLVGLSSSLSSPKGEHVSQDVPVREDDLWTWRGQLQ